MSGAEIPLAMLAASAISAGASYMGTQSINSGNRANTVLGINFEREQRAWQESMSNSAWQRGVNDMRLAGLNPILAVSQGPASSPTPTGHAQFQPVQSPLANAASAGLNAASTAAGIASTIQGINQSRSQVNLQGAQAAQATAAAGRETAQAALMGRQTGLVDQQTATEALRQGLVTAQTATEGARQGSLSAAAGLDTQRTATEREETGLRGEQRRDYERHGPPGGWRSNLVGARRTLEEAGNTLGVTPGGVANSGREVWQRMNEPASRSDALRGAGAGLRLLMRQYGLNF